MTEKIERIKGRIEIQARNLLYLHRSNIIDKAGEVKRGPQPVSPNDMQMMLIAMGRQVAMMVLEEMAPCPECVKKLKAEFGEGMG